MPTSREATMPSIPDRVYERLMARTHRKGEHLVSDYSAGSHGYSQIGWWDGERIVMTVGHRAVWIHERGPIPDGMTIDHRQGECPRKCIEITHLRMIPNFDNARRNHGIDFPFGQCARGHSDASLVMRSRGPANGGGYRRRCIECEREDQRAYRTRRKARS